VFTTHLNHIVEFLKSLIGRFCTYAGINCLSSQQEEIMSKETQLSDEKPLSRAEFIKIQRDRKEKELYSRHESDSTNVRKD
jgi:hypothetical protein